MINPSPLTAILLPYTKIVAFCQKHHIVKMALFGSVLRNDFHAESDIDVLVEFAPNTIIGYRITHIQNELSDLLGYPVDLITFASLRETSRPYILADAQIIYESSR
ncbi:MAG: nucleotidyltransferase family protein [Anaerolineae bacterium]|jgi:hypothetical protein|nr:nucleotidyltransferase family protein [Anaerolineae bacterium]